MKTLKYLALLLLATTLICSCSSDDDNGSTETPTTSDPIIGTWQLTSIRSGETIFLLSDCQKKSTLNFEAVGTLISTSFTGNASCLSDGPQSSTWQNNGDGTYTFTEEDGSSSKANITVQGDILTRENLPVVFTDTYTKIENP